MKRIIPFVVCTLAPMTLPSSGQALLVDFSRPTSPVEAGWAAYTANHEVPGDFTAQVFAAFATNITVTPSWADDPGGAAAAKQMILRAEATPSPDLYQDWIGTDARGALGTANPFTLTISGLPVGLYGLRTHHHDPQNQTGLIDITLNDSTGATTSVDFDQSAGGGAGAVPAIFEATLSSDGSDITIVFDVQNAGVGPGTTDFLVLNGFEILPNPDSDADGLDDLWEDQHFGDNSGTVERADLSQEGSGDPDNDGATNEQEETAGSDPNTGDSDGDGLSDGDELNIHGSDPTSTDTDGDGISDDEEVIEGADGFITDPALADTDGDGVNDNLEIAANTDPTDPADTPRAAGLAVDFNSNQDNGGDSTGAAPQDSAAAHNEPFYQSYHANHEVDAEFSLATYSAFGTNVTILPEWPDTVLNTVKQSIDRGAGNDANWNGQKLNLLTDWIGADSRTGQGGNGAFDGVTGSPTRMTMTIGNLPAGSYSWRSYHHDTEHMHPLFIMEVSTDGGANYLQIGGVRQGTDSTPAGNPASAMIYDGVTAPVSGDPADLPSTVNSCFIATGVDDVVFRYTPYPTTQVHQAFFVMNGFEIDEFPNDTDDDCFDDTEETALFGDLSQGPNDDFDNDGLDNITEIIGATDVVNPDSDGDGLNDGDEVNVHGSDPLVVDSDGDGLTDGDEVNTHLTDPTLIDTDGDGFDDGFEVAQGAPFDPTVDDSGTDHDGDGLTTGDEVTLWGSDPLLPDTDGDGLEDGDEVNNHFTSPILADSDDDGLDDGDELDEGTDPNNFDTDFDGMDDGFEVNNGLDPLTDDAGLDPDGDLLINGDEFIAGTDPNDPDTDADGLDDNDEWNVWFTDPLNVDSDGDGLRDGDEVNIHGTDPGLVDSDFDGDSDGKEILAGSDPTDELSLADNDMDGFNNGREIAAGSDPDNILSFPLPPGAGLFVDFNSNQDTGGDSTTDPDPAASLANHHQPGYQSYHANHEMAAEFVTADYAAFGTTISFTPSWPNTTSNLVMQSIDRGNGNDVNWNGDLINLLTDWIGADSRPANGGNGNFDGVVGTPTQMDFTLSGLPAGTYNWRSYHHDTEHMNATMQMEVSTDGGLTFGAPIVTTITDSTPAGTPASVMTYDGPGQPGSLDPADLPSTINTSFVATGADDVVIRFTPYSEIGVHRQFSVVNAFELTVPGAAPGRVTITKIVFDGGDLEVTGEGFTPGVPYLLRRSVDGVNFVNVGPAFTPAGSAHTEFDGAAPAGEAYYQFWTP